MSTTTVPDVVVSALRLGDDALIASQRLAEWSSRVPVLEEDIALTNIALDLLGQARALLTYAGEVEGAGRSEDYLAYLRSEREFTNCQLVEQPNGDFATTMARYLYFSAYQQELYRRLRATTDATLAAIAGKAVKEVDYHLDHAAGWVIRLGDGTEESHRRMQAGAERVWPFTFELFEGDEVTDRLAAAAVSVDPCELRAGWEATVGAVLAEATLTVPSGAGSRAAGGGGSTASTWGSCWRRCSTCTVPIRGRGGEHRPGRPPPRRLPPADGRRRRAHHGQRRDRHLHRPRRAPLRLRIPGGPAPDGPLRARR